MGDSGYDRVIDLPNQNNEIRYLNDFKGNKKNDFFIYENELI